MSWICLPKLGGGYAGEPSVFDNISEDDLIMAFFPCIYFTGSTNPCYFTLENTNYRNLSLEEKLDAILNRAEDRQVFYDLLIRLVGVCLKKGLRIVIENPYSTTHYLNNNFFKNPSFVDKNRRESGDFFQKPTGYWFFNCEPTSLKTYQAPAFEKNVWDARPAKSAGLCSEERSMISPDYARNFICDKIIGKPQKFTQLSLFDNTSY